MDWLHLLTDLLNPPADWLYPLVDLASPSTDKASPSTDEASPPADKASPFGPYIFTEFSPSFLNLSISSCVCMFEKKKITPLLCPETVCFSR